ncbi:putative SENSORY TRANSDUCTION HISTIDINE KINASE [Vibrio tapetis subsp. tapetis]|uniref:histidine kinase n=2 Tax=Vibrio tapetis TaxID=52443 RepID=A0A2N8ZJM2_9VIBR|nr:putative SENSORY TRANSDUCTION HISTIDINE KINASE [Vibrio tapetis subsp. tapetis]
MVKAINFVQTSANGALMIKAFSLLWLVILILIAFFFNPITANPITKISEIISKDIYQELYGPTLRTIHEDLTSQPPQDWQQTIQNLQPHFGMQLKLVDIAELPLSPANLTSIKEGEMAYHIADPSALVMGIKQSEQAIYLAMDLASDDYGKLQASGPIFLLVREMKKLPRDQRSVQLNKITLSMPVAATIEHFDSIELPEDQKSLLLAGEIASVINENEDQILFALIEDKDILRVIDDQSTSVQILFMGAIVMGIMLCIAAVMMLWAIPLWRDLKRLVSTTNQYGNGDLQARAKTSKWSVVAQLGTSFNQMANNVEKLVLGHRDLTNAIAHDLRTPLYRLRFALEMLKDNEISKENKEKYNRSVDKSMDDLDHLINQTLILSRYSRSAPNANQIVPCVLQPILRSEINHFHLEHPSLSVEFNCATLIESEEVMVDQRAMIRAMNNLLSNAARYAKSRVDVTFERHTKGWVLIIEDDGIGIPQDLWESIFDPFTQVDNEERNTTTGYGLGLAIVKQIAIWHEGDAFVSQSALGGAKFTLCWDVMRTGS